MKSVRATQGNAQGLAKTQERGGAVNGQKTPAHKKKSKEGKANMKKKKS